MQSTSTASENAFWAAKTATAAEESPKYHRNLMEFVLTNIAEIVFDKDFQCGVLSIPLNQG